MLRRAAWLLAAAAWCGCGDGDVDLPAAAAGTTTATTSTATPSGCEPGTWPVDGECRPAGVPADVPMPPPFVEPEAGVPADGCDPGFTSDGNFGCTPILPAAACPPGELAVPGDAECHEVAPCAPGTWGDIPVDATTVYVDASYGGVDADGSAAHPFPAVQLAVDAATDGAIVAIAAGTYNGHVVVTTPGLALWGRCPSLVTLVATGDDPVVRVTAAPAVAIRSLALVGGDTLARFAGSPDGRVERAWLHGAPNAAVWVGGLGAPVVVSESLVEHASGGAVVAYGGSMRVERSLLRDTNPYPDDGSFGHGVLAVMNLESATRSSVEVVGSVVERNRDVGVFSGASDVVVVGSVVRDQQLGSDQTLGAGVLGYALPGSLDRASIAVRGSVVEGTIGSGVQSDGSDVLVERTVVRGVVQTPAGASHGVTASRGFADTTAELTVRDSLVEQTEGHGAAAFGCKLHLERVRIRDIQPAGADLEDGQGVLGLQNGSRSEITMDGCVVERVRTYAVDLFGSDATVAHTALRDVEADDDGLWGGGVGANSGSTIELTDSRIERVVSGGVVAFGSDATVRRSTVRDVALQAIDGLAGAGLFFSADGGVMPQALVSESLIESVHTSGIAAVDARLVLERTLVRDVDRGDVTTDYGAGIHVARQDPTARRDLLEARWSTIERTRAGGVSLLDADALLEGVSVADVVAQSTTGLGGGGIGLLGSTGPIGVAIHGCRVSNVQAYGVAADWTQIAATGLLVQDVESQQADGKFGRGVTVQKGSAGTLDNSRVDRARDVGVLVHDSSLTLTAVTVRDTRARRSDGALGDGIAIEAPDPPGRLVLEGCRVEASERAGVAAFGAAVALGDTVLECNPIALDAERSTGVEASYSDLGGNVCGCDGTLEPCRVLSASLAPPEALDH